MDRSDQADSSSTSSLRVRGVLLSRWLASLCVVSAAFAVQALILPRWPRSPDLSAASWLDVLERAGLSPRPLPALPPSRSSERALSPGLVWQLGGGPHLSLVQATAARRDHFQTAFLTRDLVAVSLSQRRRNVPIPGSDSGLIQGRPAVQTCLVPQPDGLPLAATTAQALSQAADRRVRSPLATVRGLVGLQSSRSFSCLLVTLRSASMQPLSPARWTRLLPILQTAVHTHRLD